MQSTVKADLYCAKTSVMLSPEDFGVKYRGRSCWSECFIGDRLGKITGKRQLIPFFWKDMYDPVNTVLTFQLGIMGLDLFTEAVQQWIICINRQKSCKPALQWMPNLSNLRDRRSLSLGRAFCWNAKNKNKIKNYFIDLYYQKQFRKCKATLLYHKETIVIVAKAS